MNFKIVEYVDDLLDTKLRVERPIGYKNEILRIYGIFLKVKDLFETKLKVRRFI